MTETDQTLPEQPTDDKSAAKPTLADSLASLDEDTRKFVLGEVEKARSEAKGLRNRVKDLEPKASQLDTLQAQQQTVEERAQQAAQAAQDRATAAIHKAAKTTVKTALSGVVDDPESIIDDLNLAKFVTDDGEIDEDAVTALREKYAALGGGTRRAPRPDASQASGSRGASVVTPKQEFASFIQGALTR